MSHITKEEYLSAFLDGEAGSFEQHRICDQLAADDTMRDKLSNFSLIGEAMKSRSQAEVATSSFLVGIQDAIADEAPLSLAADDSTVVSLETIKAKKKRVLPKQAFGYAVAASVAAVAAISFQNYTSTPEVDQQFAATALLKPAKSVNVSSMIPSIKTSSPKAAKVASSNDYFIAAAFKAPDAQTKNLMDKYVAHHLQYAGSSTLMPRVRAVSYSTDF